MIGGVVGRFEHHAVATGGRVIERLEVVTTRGDAREGLDGVIEVAQRDESLLGVQYGGASVAIGHHRCGGRGQHLVEGLRHLQRLGGLGLLRLDGFAQRRRRHAGVAQQALFHQLTEAAAHLGHLEAVEEGVGLRPVPSAQGDVVQGEVQRHVADEQHDLLVVARALFVGRQVLSKLRRQVAQVGVEIVHVAVLREEFGRGLLPHARDPGQVVRGVAAQRGE